MSYSFKPIPPDKGQFNLWLEGELRSIAESFNRPELLLKLPLTYVAPSKPREGDIRNADGTEWDPGYGKGLYLFQDGVWVPLGGADGEGGGGPDHAFAYFVSE